VNKYKGINASANAPISKKQRKLISNSKAKYQRQAAAAAYCASGDQA
jgi:hypothetical protein